MDHRIRNLHTNTNEIHEKTKELHEKTTVLHTNISELHEQINSAEYATQDYVDEKVPDLTGLIEKEVDAVETEYGIRNIITIGDLDTGHINIGVNNVKLQVGPCYMYVNYRDELACSNFTPILDAPITLPGHVTTKKYVDDAITTAVSNIPPLDISDRIEMSGNGTTMYLAKGYGECSGLRWGGADIEISGNYLVFNKRLTADKTMSGAYGTDYLTKSEVQSMIPDVSQLATKQFVLDKIAEAIANL
jgi:hypothetical protein